LTLRRVTKKGRAATARPCGEGAEGGPAVKMQKGEITWRRLSLLLWFVPAILFAAAAYELVLALGLVGSYIGSAPGEGVAGEEIVAGVAAQTMLVAAVAAVVHAVWPRWPWPVALFAPAAAAFVTARFYTYDPYYAPNLRRYSDGGAMPAEWILSMLAVSIVVGVSTRLQPRAGSVVTAFTLPLLLFTWFVTGIGH
jgi:hypothetical protein